MYTQAILYTPATWQGFGNWQETVAGYGNQQEMPTGDVRSHRDWVVLGPGKMETRVNQGQGDSSSSCCTTDYSCHLEVLTQLLLSSLLFPEGKKNPTRSS